ncbi:MAG TPA: cation-translocating P-type ATPase, partial [Thermodesulfobacteriota bacterium]|nr:cation-translocating P-type ATPase [Thermodesulfobacteriota bacterium]
KAMIALKRLEMPVVTVRREGMHRQIPAREVVAGDVLLLSAGERVSADLRLLETFNLSIDESALTGESVPVEKAIDPLPADTLPPDQKNMAFMGTVITYGRGTGVVVNTGMATELGKIAHQLQDTGEKRTPLQMRLEKMGKKLALAALLLCAVIFIVGILRNIPTQLMFLTAISLAVAAIPESLPAVITIVLALGAYRMVKKNVLIRKLPAVETLGCVTTICSDKTGTLTLNRMSVELIYSGEGLREEWDIKDPLTLRLFQAMVLCNDAHLDEGNGTGDPLEVALLKAGIKVGINKEILEKDYPRIDESPFDSLRKRMTTVHRTPDGHSVAFVKGAIDSLLEISPYILTKNGREELGEEIRKKILLANEEMALDGVRVLALAYRQMDETRAPDEVERDLTFLGLVGMADPPREEAKEAVNQCLSAGIRPVMITGDHPATAAAIARELGILKPQGRMVGGRELAALSQEELTKIIEEISVFARVSPEDKIHIVQALKSRGHIVAMTGDGVNDAPALKGADIGVAMGIAGTDVSKEASDMILLDDNFVTIVSAVKEGRIIYDNIRKFIRYMLSTNSGELLTMFFALMLGMPLPLLPTQILWINIVTDSLPALALGLEPGERDVMKRPPRDPKEGIFARGLWQHMVWVGIWMSSGILGIMWWACNHCDEQHVRTMTFFAMAAFQMFHVMAIRSERESTFAIGLFSNRPLLFAVILTFVLQVLVTYTPFLQVIFKTVSLTTGELLLCVGVSATLFGAVEAEKFLLQRLRKRSKS